MRRLIRAAICGLAVCTNSISAHAQEATDLELIYGVKLGSPIGSDAQTFVGEGAIFSPLPTDGITMPHPFLSDVSYYAYVNLNREIIAVGVMTEFQNFAHMNGLSRCAELLTAERARAIAIYRMKELEPLSVAGSNMVTSVSNNEFILSLNCAKNLDETGVYTAVTYQKGNPPTEAFPSGN